MDDIKQILCNKIKLEGEYEFLYEMQCDHPIIYRLFYRKRMSSIVKRLAHLNSYLCEKNVRMEVSYIDKY